MYHVAPCLKVIANGELVLRRSKEQSASAGHHGLTDHTRTSES